EVCDFSDSSHDSNANAADDEVSSVVRSLIMNPPIMTTVVATTVAANTSSTLVPRAGDELVRASIFTDSAILDFEMPPQIYVPKWNVLNEYALDNSSACHGLVDHLAPLTCLCAEVRMRLDHTLREKKRLEGRFNRKADLFKERDVEMASLRAQLSLKEAKAKEEICLRGQVATIEAAEVIRASELESLKEHNATLEGKLSCDELSVKVASFKSEKDKLIDQVCMLEGTYFRLHDEVTGYKLFKEQIEVLQDKRVRVPSDCVVGLDSDLIKMALHMNKEFYPHYLTTIAGQMWILGRGLKLVVLKCLQSPEYLVALGGSIGPAINKGMQDGLAAGIDHGKVERGLIDVFAYNPSVEANCVSAIDALRMTAYVPYVSDNGVSPFLDLIMVRFVSIRPAPEPSTQDDPSVNSVYGYKSSSSASMGASRGLSFERSTKKSTKIYHLNDVLGLYCMSYSPSSMLHFCNLPAISGHPHILPDFCQFAFGMLYLPNIARMTSEGYDFGPETIVHSSGIILLLCRVSTPLGTRNVSIPWAVNGIAWIFLILGMPMIPSAFCSVPCSSSKDENEISGSGENFAFNEHGVGDSVHDLEDSHAFRSSLNVPTLIFESLHKILCGLSFSLLDVRMRGVKGSVSSHTHGWDKSSSSILDFRFFNLDFQYPLSLSSPSENVSVPREGVPSCLLNTPLSFLPFPFGLCLGDSDLSRVILEKTLSRSGLLEMLRERPDLRPLRIPEGLHRTRASSGSLRVLSGFGSLVGLGSQAPMGSDLVLNKLIEVIFCTNEGKPLALPWGRDPRLDSGVRVSTHVVRYDRSGTFIGQASSDIVTADADCLPRTGVLVVKGLASVILKGVRSQVQFLLGANNSEVATPNS
nr:hypothetical protein [Tanacetum cinerariifolium]